MDLLSGLFFTTERPSVVGGLGRVSVDIPMALNKHARMDCRVMQPITRAVSKLDRACVQEERFRPTGLSIVLRTQGGGSQCFELSERYESSTQTWIYGVSNELFAQFDHLYFSLDARFEDAALEDAFGHDAIFSANMLFTRAASLLARFLHPAAKLPGGITLKRFDHGIDFVVLNDWLTAQAAQELFSADGKDLSADAPPPLADAVRIFMIHNVYDEKRSIKQTQRNCVSVPVYVQDEAMRHGARAHKAVRYSPFRTGVRLSDWLIVDGNYLDTLLEAPTDLPEATKEELRIKRARGSYTTVVHAPSHIFNPVGNEFLTVDGFRPLPSDFFLEHKDHPVRTEILRDYKRVNKSALQKKYGDRKRTSGYLHEDEQAIIYCWAGRFDPYQKGFFLMASTIKEFLLGHSGVQLIVAGGGGGQPAEEKLIEEFLAGLLQDCRLAGRVVRAGERDEFGRVRSLDARGMVQMLAGGSALMCPSLYEPYGLSHLEGMWLGTAPVAHGVDGLLSTITDVDELEAPLAGCCRPDARHGATGILMSRVANPAQYENALRSWLAEQSSDIKSVKSTLKTRMLLEKANGAFRDLLERSLLVFEDEFRNLQLLNNALSYIHEEHDWSKISLRYRSAIESAIKRRSGKQVVLSPAQLSAVSF